MTKWKCVYFTVTYISFVVKTVEANFFCRYCDQIMELASDSGIRFSDRLARKQAFFVHVMKKLLLCEPADAFGRLLNTI